MAKIIEFDLSGTEDEVWEQGEGDLAEQPKPGIYKALIREINPGYSKTDGKPDKSRPRLEVVLDVVGDAKGSREALKTMGNEDGGDCHGARIWDYVSFSAASEWKQAQFFKAIGEGSPKKAKGKFNAEKHEGKTEIRIRLKADSNLDGEYRAKVASMWAWDDDGDTGSDIDDELADELDDDTVDELSDEEEWTEESLGELDAAELKNVAKLFEVEVVKGKRKTTYISEILEAQAATEDADEDDDFDMEDEEDDDVLDDDLPTAEEVREMSPAELKELAKEHGVSLKGLKKQGAIDKLIEEIGIEDDDDVPF